MVVPIEEQELTTQRDAVVSLCKGLQEKVTRSIQCTHRSRLLRSNSVNCKLRCRYEYRVVQLRCCRLAAGNVLFF